MTTARVAIVTGGGRGIGRAIAERLLADGYKVAIGQRGATELEKTRAELEARFDAGPERLRALSGFDVRNQNQVESLFDVAQRFLGAPNVVVNSAGILEKTPIGDPTDIKAEALWNEVLKTNLTGAFFVTRSAAAHIPDHADGRIIHIASVLAKFGVATRAAYCASKHGLIGLVRAAMHELSPRGITVNAVCPGWVETEMTAASIAEYARDEGISADEMRRRAEDAVPLKRFSAPDEIAAFVAFLASPAAKAINGQALSICNGATAF
ncbi:MAG: SDR family oxidoreductase [Deltaproteobacteria bacterium]|nr:SDR family oxidoreductase [Deltaproteobacteria bacterium]